MSNAEAIEVLLLPVVKTVWTWECPNCGDYHERDEPKTEGFDSCDGCSLKVRLMEKEQAK